ncbi:Abi family protein [Vibrio vulnificus]|uniref:Abi family protein n=1 Tax=Vibrio vulnificus TaxID=672 RepID=UPI003F6633FC
MPVQSIVKSLSSTRLSTYQKPNLCDTTQEQSLGLYVWNKQLSGLFYPVLQVLEIALRNAIYNSYIEHENQQIEATFPQAQWGVEKAKIDPFWFANIYTRTNNRTAFSQINKAKSDLMREGKAITPDNLIAKLTFGFWVHMTDKNHRSSTTGATPIIELWPHLTRKVFPHALAHDGTALSINNISSKLFDVNLLRNRIAHHEPIWKSDDLFDADDAINMIVNHYELLLKLIRWINPDCLKLLSVIDNDKLMGIACSQHTLWRSKMLTTGISTVPELSDWKIRHEIDTRRLGEVVSADARFAIIRCSLSHLPFYTNRTMQTRKKAWPLTVGSQVSFIPKPNPTQPHPNATKVKPV